MSKILTLRKFAEIVTEKPEADVLYLSINWSGTRIWAGRDIAKVAKAAKAELKTTFRGVLVVRKGRAPQVVLDHKGNGRPMLEEFRRRVRGPIAKLIAATHIY